MKNYSVVIESKGEYVSSFTVKANNLKEAKKRANFNKRIEALKGKTIVKYIKPVN